MMKMRRPVPNPNFTHQFESLRIKLETSIFFFKSACIFWAPLQF